MRHFRILIIGLIVVWTALAAARTFYNFSKLFSEEKEWYFLSDEAKRRKLFGDLYYFFRFVEKNTSREARIIFYAPGGKAYYLGRYYLYPRRLTYAKTENEVRNFVKSNRYDYILSYQTKDKELSENNNYTLGNIPYKIILDYVGNDKFNSLGLIYKL